MKFILPACLIGIVVCLIFVTKHDHYIEEFKKDVEFLKIIIKEKE